MIREMAWDCHTDPKTGESRPGVNCYLKKRVLRFSLLNEALPDGMGFTDGDGLVERNGHLLLLEWKDPTCPLKLSKGQYLLYKRGTRSNHLTVYVIRGDVETMQPFQGIEVWRGHFSKWSVLERGKLLERIRAWWDWADRHPAPRI